MTVISVGTSIPGMTTSVYGAYYGAGDLVVGNIVGSETAQITLAVGVVALVEPIVARRRNVAVYGSAMVLAMVVMVLTLEDGAVTRSEGVLMMLAYVNFVYTLYTNEGGREVGEDVADEEEPPAGTRPAESPWGPSSAATSPTRCSRWASGHSWPTSWWPTRPPSCTR